jgi:hypothetical protein
VGILILSKAIWASAIDVCTMGLTAIGELTMVVLAVGVYTGFMHYGLKGYR